MNLKQFICLYGKNNMKKNFQKNLQPQIKSILSKNVKYSKCFLFLTKVRGLFGDFSFTGKFFRMFGNNVPDMNKKAIFFSTDALIALIIILITASIAYPIITYSNYDTLIQSDILNVLSTLKIGEINNIYVKGLIAEGKITDLNKSVLEQIGDFYISNVTLAKELGNSVLSDLNTRENIGLWFDNELISSQNSTPYESSRNVEVDKQIISGIQKGKATKGFVAKAWLKKIDRKKNTLFIKGDLMCGGWTWFRFYNGYYCSQIAANATYNFYIPPNATITNATWLAEPSWTPQYTKLYVNGNKIYEGNINYYVIKNISNYLVAGDNNAMISGNIGAEDGASHIIIEYYTPDMATFHQQTIFPFNKLSSKSILYYEKSMFIPTQIYNINISINASMNTTISIRKGTQTIFIGSKNPVNNTVLFSDAEIKNALNSQGVYYSDLSDEYFFIIVEIGRNARGTSTKLGENSYVYVNSSEIPVQYGTIDITGEIPIKNYSNLVAYTFYRNLTWEFFLPQNSIPIFSDWQFGWFLTGITTQKAISNSLILYNSPPDPFLNIFSRFGYTPLKDSRLFREGENNFSLEFGNGYSVSNEASYGFLTYFIKGFVNYGDVKDKGAGGTKTIQFEDGSSKEISVGNSSDPWDPADDAIDDSIERLISQLDANNNSKIDVVLDKESFDIDTLDISGVPYIWSTEVQVRRWQ